MKKDELFEKAFDHIDDKLIVDAQTVIPIVKRKRPKALLVAACITLLLSSFFCMLGIADTKTQNPFPGTSAPPFYSQVLGNSTQASSSNFSFHTAVTVAAILLLILSLSLFVAFFKQKKTKKTTASSRPSKPVLLTTVCTLVLLSVILFSLEIANQSTTQNNVTVTPWEYYEGDIENSNYDDTPVSGLIAINSSGFAISCELVEVSPSSYLIPSKTAVITAEDSVYSLLKMKTLSMPWGKGMEKDSEFYFLLPSALLCDFSNYQSFLLADLKQNAYDHFVLYNKDTSSYEAFSLPLFSNSAMMAFDENEIFDISLWTVNDAWSSNTQTQRQKIENGELDLIGLSRSDIEKQFEEKHDYQVYPNVPLTGEALDAYLDCQNPDNGLYLLNLCHGGIHERQHYSQYNLFFRRFINGYPTSETVEILSENSAKKSTLSFTESDLNALPDLASALKQVSESYHRGDLTPPHIQNLKDKTLVCYGILGWYEKTENGVLGMVRISWKYQDFSGRDTFYDDQYFVIMLDSDTAQSIDRDTLLELHPYASDLIFQGNYNENGKERSFWW